MKMLNKFLQENGGAFYLVFRILVGFMFFLHGLAKFTSGSYDLFSLMGLAGIIEFFGGLAIVFGLYVEIAAVFGGLTMIFAYFMVHAGNGWNPLVNKGELALLYLAAFLVLATVGARIDKKKR